VEGLNRVAVEGVLAGRPVIVTSVCPAAELIADAALVVPPGDVGAMRDAVLRLEGDAALYERKRTGCGALAAQFLDAESSWGAGLKRALRLALPEWFPAAAGAGAHA
jgi:glycosyltransferase involved in cell wall biosynthesis